MLLYDARRKYPQLSPFPSPSAPPFPPDRIYRFQTGDTQTLLHEYRQFVSTAHIVSTASIVIFTRSPPQISNLLAREDQAPRVLLHVLLHVHFLLTAYTHLTNPSELNSTSNKMFVRRVPLINDDLRLSLSTRYHSPWVPSRIFVLERITDRKGNQLYQTSS